MQMFCDIEIFDTNGKIKKGKNQAIEYIDDYLTGKTYLMLEDYQLIKPTLEASIVVDFSQQFILDDPSNNNYDYVKIKYYTKNNNVKTYLYNYYYFITGKKWRARSTIEYYLYCDTANSFLVPLSSSNPSKRVLFDERTNIKRSHINRYRKIGSNYNYIIDKNAEGFNPQLYRTSKEVINHHTTKHQQNYYLIYNTHSLENENPVDILLAPENKTSISNMPISLYESEEMQTNNSFESYPYYVLSICDYGQGQVHSANAEIWVNGQSWKVGGTYNGQTIDGFAYYCNNGFKNDGTLHHYQLSVYVFASTSCHRVFNKFETSVSRNDNFFKDYRVVIKNLDQYIKAINDNTASVSPTTITNALKRAFYDNIAITDWNFTNLPSTNFSRFYKHSFNLSEFNTLDRTKESLIKILMLPYYPAIDSNFSALDNMPFAYDKESGFMRLYDKEENLTGYIINSNSKLCEQTTASISPSILDVNDFSIDYDPKLLNSEFNINKLVYDSFSISYPLELIQGNDPYLTPQQNVNIDFNVSRNCNSRFYFKTNFVENTPNEDFDGVLYVQRNNELPIYSSSYINYLKTGINYDVKSKTRSELVNWVNVGVGAVGTIASAISGGAFGVVGAISLGATTLTSLVNAISQTAQQEQNFAQKIAQLKQQSATIETADDVELMTSYASNRLYAVRYGASNEMKDRVNRLFFYCGYALNKFGIPNTTTRSWWNFIQCEARFKSEEVVEDEFIEDLTRLCNEGLTFFHKNGNSWDLEQIKANWENSIL